MLMVTGPSGPVMGPVSPSLTRRATVQSVRLAPRGVPMTGPVAGGQVPVQYATSGADMYQMLVELQVPDPSGNRTLTFLDTELPKPLQVGQIVNVVFAIQVTQA